LILDEATAAIGEFASIEILWYFIDLYSMALDYETDAAIQRFLRTELGKDTTVITIAHRLQTVMDSDKIVSFPTEPCLVYSLFKCLKMVLDAGRLVEFDTPTNLLKNEDGLLRALVDESDDRDALLKLVDGKLHS
jgi:ABC-type multidrug transport system ATPase subunit